MIWAAAIVTAVLFFITLLLHELAHSFVAKSRGLSVRAITLFALGGVSQIESEAPDAKSEFWIAIVGPITSVVIGGLCVLAARLSGGTPGVEENTPVVAVLLWLGYINIALAVFNMIPGYPLDGGRVLRAILWWSTRSAQRATRWSSQVGQGVAFLFILFGLYRFFVGANFGGLWLAFIGWFLMDAARSSYVQFGVMEGLRGRKVRDLMARDCPSVPGYLSLRDFIDDYVLQSTAHCFLVTQGDQVVGVVSPRDANLIAREAWPRESVQSVMRPLDHLQAVSPDMPAANAIELMSRERASELPVIANGKVEGIFSRGQLLRFIQLGADEEGSSDDRAA